MRVSALVLVVYAGLLVLTGVQFWRAPGGFIPAQDQGYFVTIVQLPPGSSLSRTDAVVQRAIKDLHAIPGVAHTASFSGFDGATFTNASNAAAVFFTVTPFAERAAHGVDGAVVLRTARQRMAAIAEANIFVIAPPSVRGLSTTGGFKFIVQDQGARGLRALRDAAGQITAAAAREPGLTAVFSQFEVSTPQIYVDIDRDRAQAHGVPPSRVFEALEIFLGSSFVNDFNYLGRTYRVTAQADSQFRRTARNVAELRTRSDTGGMVPLGSVATFRDVSGPTRVTRYNLYPAVEVLGDMTPGTSFGQGMSTMEALAKSSLPEGFSYEWTELAFQQQQAGNTAAYVFAFAVIVVFLVLAGQYESVTLPLAVVLIVPMCLLAAITGVLLRGQDNNILTQIGLVVLVGLACKNAILIVEFAKQAEDQLKLDRFAAAAHAARVRLRPILMTSFAFILGVAPLVIATGAGAEARRALGTAVFAGMIGVTLFGLLLTPAFYVICRRLSLGRQPSDSAAGRRATTETPLPIIALAGRGVHTREAPPDDRRSALHRCWRARAASGERTFMPVEPSRAVCVRGRSGRRVRADAAAGRRVVGNVRRRSHDIARRAGVESKPGRPSSHGAGEAGAREATRARGHELAFRRGERRIRAQPDSSRVPQRPT